MKILFLSDLLAYGGASKLIYDLLQRMAAEGHCCELLILTDEHSKYIDDLKKKGIMVHVIPKEIHSHISKIKYIKRWIEKGGYDVIHANLFPTIYYCSIVKGIIGDECPPLVMTEHSTDNKRRHKFYLRLLEKSIYQKYDHVISISEKTQENLCKWLNTEGDKRFSVIENGIDVKSFKNAEPLPREELFSGIQNGDVLILTVGSFTPQKNHEKLLEALTFLPMKYKLLLCGEGPLLEEIMNKVTLFHLDNRVIFLGFRKDVDRIMHTADILAIPSIWEGFGLIAAEGMACEIPIVASDVPGLSEVIGEAGMKFNPKEPKQIADAILEISKDEIAKLYTKRSSSRCLQYDISSTVSGYLTVYRDVIGAKNAKNVSKD